MKTIDWHQIRSSFQTLVNGRIYLNSGELGIQPNQVIKTKASWETLANDLGPGSHAVLSLLLNGFSPDLVRDQDKYECLKNWTGIENLRELISTEIGASPAEITFTRNTTEAMWAVIEALPNTANRTLVYSDVEHDATFVNKYYARFVKGLRPVEVNLIEILDDPEFPKLCIEKISNVVNEKTYLVIISHVLYNCGIELPIIEIIRACKEKNPNVLVLVDGAHSLGQKSINVAEFDCDFFITAGHKWLCGPRGSGIMYCNEEIRTQRDLSIRPTGMFYTPILYEPRATEIVGKNNPRLFGAKPGFERLIEFGTIEESVLVALNETMNFYKAIGIERIQERIRELARQLRERLEQIPFVEMSPGYSVNNGCGIVSFRHKGMGYSWTYQEACNVAKNLDNEYNIECRAVPNPVLIRVCLNYYNNEDDLAKLIECLPSVLSARSR